MLYITSNFISALIYGLIFMTRFNSVPGFELSKGTLILIFLLSFVFGCIITSPIWLLSKYLIKKKKLNAWVFNFLLLMITLPLICMFQIFLWKNISDTIDILLSFELITLISLNISRTRKQIK
jgi:hypothetical protein